MKLALIPPFRHLNAIKHTTYQMALPCHFGPDTGQGNLNVFKAAHKRGDYIMLDNGVAEETVISFQQVQELGYEICAHEIVLPDVMQSMDATLAAVEAALPFVDTLTFNFMGVVQGRTMDELKSMVHYYKNEIPFVTCLGIPRHLPTTLSREDARVEIVRYIRSIEDFDESGIDIHLLGTNPKVASEINGFGRHFRRLNVRGVDTSMPFHAALQGISLDNSTTEVKREPHYFGTKIPATKAEQVWGNIVAMKEWVRGDRG